MINCNEWRQRNTTNAQIWGKKNNSNYDGNCTARHCLSRTYEITLRWIFVPLSVQSSTPDNEIVSPQPPSQTRRLGVKDFDQRLLFSLIQPTPSSCKTRTSLLNRPVPLTQRKICKSKDKKLNTLTSISKMFVM